MFRTELSSLQRCLYLPTTNGNKVGRCLGYWENDIGGDRQARHSNDTTVLKWSNFIRFAHPRRQRGRRACQVRKYQRF